MESTSPGSDCSVGSLRTQPSEHRWQRFGSSMSLCQPSGPSSRWFGVSAAAPVGCTSASEPAPAAHIKQPLLETQWHSPSSQRHFWQHHRAHQQQQPAQHDCESNCSVNNHFVFLQHESQARCQTYIAMLAPFTWLVDALQTCHSMALILMPFKQSLCCARTYRICRYFTGATLVLDQQNSCC